MLNAVLQREFEKRFRQLSQVELEQRSDRVNIVARIPLGEVKGSFILLDGMLKLHGECGSE